VENVSVAAGSGGVWSEVAVPVPFIKTFASSWHYTFTSLQSATVYDVVGLGESQVWKPSWNADCVHVSWWPRDARPAVSAVWLFTIREAIKEKKNGKWMEISIPYLDSPTPWKAFPFTLYFFYGFPFSLPLSYQIRFFINIHDKTSAINAFDYLLIFFSCRARKMVWRV